MIKETITNEEMLTELEEYIKYIGTNIFVEKMVEYVKQRIVETKYLKDVQEIALSRFKAYSELEGRSIEQRELLKLYKELDELNNQFMEELLKEPNQRNLEVMVEVRTKAARKIEEIKQVEQGIGNEQV